MKILCDAEFGRDYKAGYVFFSFDTSSWISEGIALFTAAEQESGIPVSHCGVIDRNGNCVEADGTAGYVLRSDFKKKYLCDPHTVVFCKKPIELDKRKAFILIMRALQHCGKEYSYGGLVGSALFVLLTGGHRIFPFLRKISNPFNTDATLFCSELVADGMRARHVVGKRGCLVYHPSNVYPQTLFEDPIIWSPWDSDIIKKKEEEGRKLVSHET